MIPSTAGLGLSMLALQMRTGVVIREIIDMRIPNKIVIKKIQDYVDRERAQVANF